MTTRINGQDYHRVKLPSEGNSERVRQINNDNRSESLHHVKLYKDLDAYFETKPGTENAAKALAKARRA